MNGLHHKVQLLLSIFIFIGYVPLSHSQSIRDNAIHVVYDAIVGGENTGLYNGPEFKDQFLDSWDGSHIYLNTHTFMHSTLIYNDQLYTNVALKYDLFDDNVVIRSEDNYCLLVYNGVYHIVRSISIQGNPKISKRVQIHL